jgi:hypothetical protein
MNSNRKIRSKAIGTTIVSPSDPVAGGQLHFLSNLPLCVGDKRAKIAIANICAYNNPALSIFAADLVRARRNLNLRNGWQRGVPDLWEWWVAPHSPHRRRLRFWRRQGNGQVLDRVDVWAKVLGQPHHQIEAAVPFEHKPGTFSTHGNLDETLYVSHAEPQAGKRRAVQLDGQNRQSRHLFGLGVGGAGDGL